VWISQWIVGDKFPSLNFEGELLCRMHIAVGSECHVKICVVPMSCPRPLRSTFSWWLATVSNYTETYQVSDDQHRQYYELLMQYLFHLLPLPSAVWINIAQQITHVVIMVSHAFTWQAILYCSDFFYFHRTYSSVVTKQNSTKPGPMAHLWMWVSLARYENGCPKFRGSSPITRESKTAYFRVVSTTSWLKRDCHMLDSEPYL